MHYDYIVRGIFKERPNRFIAHIWIDNVLEICHVKNTGRCRELLIEGVEVWVQRSSNPNRKTNYDLIAVKKANRIINIDSQIPNKVFHEWLLGGSLFQDIVKIKPEFTYGNSRVDFLVETKEAKHLIEIKGVTLEEDNKVLFPDAPTERGLKHIYELIECIDEGFIPLIVFVIQLSDVDSFSPNRKMHPEFADALRLASRKGVGILAFECKVDPENIIISEEVPIIL